MPSGAVSLFGVRTIWPMSIATCERSRHARLMPVNPDEFTVESIIADLRVLRERGLIRLRHTDVAALSRSAARPGVAAAARGGEAGRKRTGCGRNSHFRPRPRRPRLGGPGPQAQGRRGLWRQRGALPEASGE